MKAVLRNCLPSVKGLISVFALVATVAVGAAALNAQSAAAATTPTTAEACAAQGGTWSYQGSAMSCSGATFALGMSLEQQVQSFIYYRTLGFCVTQGGDNLSDGAWPVLNGQRINQANAKSGSWFNGSSAYGGGFLDGVNGIRAPYNDANVLTACNQASLVNGALGLWGEWAPDEALCAFGFRRADDGEANAGRCTDRQGGSDEFMKGASVTSSYKQAVKSRVYGGKEPAVTANTAWTKAGTYLLYLSQLKLVCVPKATITTTAPTGSTDRDYALRTPTRADDGTIEWTTTYYTGLSNKKHSDGANAIVVGSDFGGSLGVDTDPSLGGSCGALLDAINGEVGEDNGLADAYADWLKTNTGERDSAEQDYRNPEDETSSCNIDGVGWIICPLLTFGANVADASFDFLSDSFLTIDAELLNTDPAATTGTGTYSAWRVMQGFANVTFVIAFLVIIFSQLTSVGVSNYGVKKLLPRIIIAAILVNISFFVCQIVVDVSNILGFGLKSALEAVASQVTTAGGVPSGPDESGHLGGILLIVLALTGSALWIGVGAIGIAILGALVSLLTIFALLVVRKALIVLLIVLAPLAFVAYLLPNTEPLFHRWRKMFTALLMLFPIIGLLYGAGLLASAVLLQTAGDDIVMQIVGYFVLVVPLLAVIPLLRGSLDGIGKLGAAINNAGNKARSGAQGGAKGIGTAYKNSAFGKFRAGITADRKSRIATGTYAGAGGRLNPRNWRSAANRGLNSNRALNLATGGFGAERELAGEAQNRKDIKEAIDMFGGDDALAIAWAQSGGSTRHAAFTGLSDPQKRQFQKMVDAGHHRKSTSHLAAAQYLSENGKGDAATVSSALARARAAGANSTVVGGATQGAIAAYRKSGRGDALADLSTAAGTPMSQEQGWAQVAARAVHRDGITPGSAGRSAYESYLQGDPEATRKALVGFDSMEARAQGSAQAAILAAAQLHQYNATGATPTISTIQDAKAYFNVK